MEDISRSGAVKHHVFVIRCLSCGCAPSWEREMWSSSIDGNLTAWYTNTRKRILVEGKNSPIEPLPMVQYSKSLEGRLNW